MERGKRTFTRRALLEASWATLRDGVLRDLARPHPELAREVRRLDVMRYGHAMVRPEVGFVVHEERGAHLLRQVDDVHASDGEPTVGRHRRGVGQQSPAERGRHIDSGAETPRSPRATARPMRAPSTNHRRACVSSSPTSCPMT